MQYTAARSTAIAAKHIFAQIDIEVRLSVITERTSAMQLCPGTANSGNAEQVYHIFNIAWQMIGNTHIASPLLTGCILSWLSELPH